MMQTPRATRLAQITINANKFCKNPKFHAFLTATYGEPVTSEPAAAKLLKSVCQIATRKALATDPNAATRFAGVIRRFNQYSKQNSGNRVDS